MTKSRTIRENLAHGHDAAAERLLQHFATGIRRLGRPDPGAAQSCRRQVGPATFFYLFSEAERSGRAPVTGQDRGQGTDQDHPLHERHAPVQAHGTSYTAGT